MLPIEMNDLSKSKYGNETLKKEKAKDHNLIYQIRHNWLSPGNINSWYPESEVG